MKNKTKLLMTLISMCLVITLGVIGILAVKKLDLNIGGNVSFSAEGVNIEVSQGKFYTDASHTSEYTGLVTNAMLGFSIDTDTPESTIQDELATWSGLTLNLDSRGDAYLHFTVKNKMTDTLYIALTVDNGTQDVNENISIKTIESVPTIVGNTAEAQDFTFHFDIKDTDVNASLTDFKIDLTFSLVATQVEVNAQGAVDSSMGAKYTGVKYIIGEDKKVTLEKNNPTGDIVIASSVKAPNGEVLKVTEIPANMFFDEEKYEGAPITSVVISEGVTAIGTEAFGSCSNLKSITIPNSVKTIGDGAFSESGLENVSIPSSVKSLGSGLFLECESLKTAYVDVEVVPSICFANCYELTTVTFSDNVKTISSSAFASCSKLTSVTLPSSLQTLNTSAFEMSGLKSIHIPASVTNIDGNEYYCSPFFQCDMESITVDSGNIKYKVVSGCLIDIDAKTVIQASKNARIPTDANVATKMVYGVYFGVTVDELVVPANITEICSTALAAKGITSVSFKSTTPPQGYELSLDGDHEITTIYVPTGAKANYEGIIEYREMTIIEDPSLNV